MHVILYYGVGSPNCRKVHAVINHLELAVNIEYYDFFNGKLHTPQRELTRFVPSLVGRRPN